MMNTCKTGTVAILLLLALSSVSDAEYLIYLKGGHFIVADDCTFSTGQAVEKGSETSERPIPAKDCTKGKPQGPIAWSTIDGSFGELNADDVYAIFGTKSLPPLKPPGATMPLEDYLITNRGQSFVNSKDAPEEEGPDVYGRKRDELIKVDRRGVIEISPERLATSRSGEGLCPGEPIEFAVSEMELVKGHLVGAVTNISKVAWRPAIEVEVRAKGRLLGKFEVEDQNNLQPDDVIVIDSPVDGRFVQELERIKDPEAGIRLCYRKVKTGSTKGTNR